MEYDVGQRIGLTGTPMILAEDGTQMGGYLPPAALREALDKRGRAGGGRRGRYARRLIAFGSSGAGTPAPRAQTGRRVPGPGFATIAGPSTHGSPDMIVLEGQPALSHVPPRRGSQSRLAARPSRPAAARRLARLLRRTRSRAPTPDGDALRRILQAGAGAVAAAPKAPSRASSTPRLGTLSPWASKATELLHGAGLPVKRVERGLRSTWPAGRPTPPRRRPRAACCTTR